MRRAALALLLALAAAPVAHAQAALPAGWRVVPAITSFDSPAGRCANTSRDDWSVALSADSGRLLVSPAPEESPDPRVELRVAGGRLVAGDYGEWGGGIWWVPDAGAPTQVFNKNTSMLLALGPQVYALGGLSHRFTNRGEVYRVSRGAGGAWTVARTDTLSAAPRAVTVTHGDSLLVVTLGALDLVVPGAGRRVLHRNAMWRASYPNSVVRDRASVVYVGMRSAVARLTPLSGGGYREEWLVTGSGCGGG